MRESDFAHAPSDHPAVPLLQGALVVLVLVALPGCQLVGPMVVDPYYQTTYTPSPDDRVEFRQALLSDEGRLKLIGWVWAKPQPMVLVNRGFEVELTLPDHAPHLSTLIVDHQPDLTVTGGNQAYKTTVAGVPQRCVTPEGQRVGMAMVRDGQYRRFLTRQEIEGGFIPPPVPDQNATIFFEAGGFDGFLSTGLPAPQSSPICESRLVIYKLDNQDHKNTRNPEYLVVGRPTETSDHLVVFMTSTGELVKRF